MEGRIEAMLVENVLHMNGGDGETSYAENSKLQKTGILSGLPILEESIKNMYNEAFDECIAIADLGCSSGTNTFFVIALIIDNVRNLCQQNSRKAPEFQVFLNDLVENDFNTTFKSLPTFYAKLKKEKGDNFGPCFISGVPGSFYGRLFRSKSLHFVHSSYGVHWLSQVPEGLENNKGNIYLSKSNPPNVPQVYSRQFQKDFSTFLHLRAQEVIPNGRMLLTLGGRNAADPTSEDNCCSWDLLAKSLLDMATEGLVKEADIDSFNLPYYSPYKDEVKAIIEEEGSFTLDRLEVLEFDWDSGDIIGDKDLVSDTCSAAKSFALVVRAITESMVASHFGNSIIEDLFERYAKHVAEYVKTRKVKFYDLVVALKKK